MNTLIRRVMDTELEQILHLQYLAYESEAQLLGNYDIPPLKQTLNEVRKEFQDGIFLAAEDKQGNIIGSVRGHEKNGTLFVGKLMVHPLFRNRGIGSRLLGEIEKTTSCSRFELFTSNKSLENIKLYQKNGYEIFREVQAAPDLTFVFMEKHITSGVDSLNE